MNITLNPLQAFNAMTHLVESYYKGTHSDDAGSLLSDILFVDEKCTADPAAWKEWIKLTNNKSFLTKQEAFEGMIHFLSNYQKNTHSVDIQWLIDDMLSSTSSTNKRLWDKFIEEVLQEPEGSREYLELTK